MPDNPAWIIVLIAVSCAIAAVVISRTVIRSRREARKRDAEVAADRKERDNKATALAREVSRHPEWPQQWLCAKRPFNPSRFIGDPCPRCGHVVCGVMANPCDVCSAVSVMHSIEVPE